MSIQSFCCLPANVYYFHSKKRYYFSSFLAVVSEFGPPHYLIIIIIIIRSREPPTIGRTEENAAASQRNRLRVLLSHNYNYTQVYTCRTVRLYCVMYRCTVLRGESPIMLTCIIKCTYLRTIYYFQVHRFFYSTKGME